MWRSRRCLTQKAIDPPTVWVVCLAAARAGVGRPTHTNFTFPSGRPVGPLRWKNKRHGTEHPSLPQKRDGVLPRISPPNDNPHFTSRQS